ncbi:cytosolic carboxypeptidase 6 [Copidosoma floridanum]|uniref:cytosolic carboxypeptidase 6 n=1 Tax=Copidosoma floridanum TaxID=29053 RepID=UPI000C6F5C29|nr:cytosolic carboxypeptidase 6 [Copidosoma floridanum]
MTFQKEGKNPLEHTSLYQRADSEESDIEGGYGNVNRLIIRPSDHSGKAKRGHLCFDASFETGNLGRVDLISEFEYDLFVRPDTCGPRLRYWFNFTVNNVCVEQRVVFNIVNISKKSNLFRRGMTPLVKSSTRPKWQRLPSTQVFYYKSNIHQDHYIMSFTFSFDREDDLYHFALSYPYSYTRHLVYLDNLKARYPFLEREIVTSSVKKKKIELVTITDKKKNDVFCKRQEQQVSKMVVIIGRMHPGESPSSFVCQGALDFLISNHPIARILRNNVVFRIIPMLNPDGVYIGNYRSTLIGSDLNRSWNRMSMWTQPVLMATKTLLQSWDTDTKTIIDCVFDLHAHSNATGLFVYGNAYDDVYRYERHIVIPKLISQLADDYEPFRTMYNQDSYKESTARRYIRSIVSEHVNCYTLHVSMYGYTRKGTSSILPYTEESCILFLH